MREAMPHGRADWRQAPRVDHCGEQAFERVRVPQRIRVTSGRIYYPLDTDLFHQFWILDL